MMGAIVGVVAIAIGIFLIVASPRPETYALFEPGDRARTGLPIFLGVLLILVGVAAATVGIFNPD